MHDMIIVGGGPAGLTAAIYGLRAGKSVLVIEKNGFGGQIAYSPKVENIPGTKLISGTEFADALTDQAMALGADVELTVPVCAASKVAGQGRRNLLRLSEEHGTRVRRIIEDQNVRDVLPKPWQASQKQQEEERPRI